MAVTREGGQPQNFVAELQLVRLDVSVGLSCLLLCYSVRRATRMNHEHGRFRGCRLGRGSALRRTRYALALAPESGEPLTTHQRKSQDATRYPLHTQSVSPDSPDPTRILCTCC